MFKRYVDEQTHDLLESYRVMVALHTKVKLFEYAVHHCSFFRIRPKASTTTTKSWKLARGCVFAWDENVFVNVLGRISLQARLHFERRSAIPEVSFPKILLDINELFPLSLIRSDEPGQDSQNIRSHFEFQCRIAHSAFAFFLWEAHQCPARTIRLFEINRFSDVLFRYSKYGFFQAYYLHFESLPVRISVVFRLVYVGCVAVAQSCDLLGGNYYFGVELCDLLRSVRWTQSGIGFFIDMLWSSLKSLFIDVH